MGKSFQIALIALGLCSISVSTPALSADAIQKNYKTFQVVKNGKGEIFLRSTRMTEKSGSAQLLGPYILKDIASLSEDGNEIVIEYKNGNATRRAKFMQEYNEQLNAWNERDANGNIIAIKDSKGNIIGGPEYEGKFRDDAHPLNLAKHLGESDWKKILARKPENLAAGCTEAVWRKGYVQGLGAQRFAIAVDHQVEENKWSPNRADRSACSEFSKKQTELKCCVQGYMEAVPEIARAIQKYANSGEVHNDPSFQRCFEEFSDGSSDGRKFCQSQYSCPQFSNKPVRYLGCYSLGFAVITHHDSCQRNRPKLFEANSQRAVIASAGDHAIKNDIAITYESECRQKFGLDAALAQ